MADSGPAIQIFCDHLQFLAEVGVGEGEKYVPENVGVAAAIFFLSGTRQKL